MTNPVRNMRSRDHEFASVLSDSKFAPDCAAKQASLGVGIVASALLAIVFGSCLWTILDVTKPATARHIATHVSMTNTVHVRSSNSLP